MTGGFKLGKAGFWVLSRLRLVSGSNSDRANLGHSYRMIHAYGWIGNRGLPSKHPISWTRKGHGLDDISISFTLDDPSKLQEP